MRTVCEQNLCAGCKACVDMCPKNAILFQDLKDSYNAVKTDLCIECGACEQVCQVNYPLEFRTPIAWVQGWTKDEEIRRRSSSGGFAAAFSIAFVDKEGFVCSCAFEQGDFKFNITNDKGKLHRFQGSKYVKSDPEGIYKQIVHLLAKGKQVLFIGLPCQSAGVQNFVPSKLQDNLFTVDLICHGTPSTQILEQFLDEQGQFVFLEKFKKIHFTHK